MIILDALFQAIRNITLGALGLIWPFILLAIGAVIFGIPPVLTVLAAIWYGIEAGSVGSAFVIAFGCMAGLFCVAIYFEFLTIMREI